MSKANFYFVLFVVVTVFSNACKKERNIITRPPLPGEQAVLLKEINIPNLPSPFYRFEYDAEGNRTFASFASGLFRYNITYDDKHIIEMQNNIAVNRDRLQYSYDDEGMVKTVSYADSNGTVYKRMYFSYSGKRLIKAEREIKTAAGFLVEKTMTFRYHEDDNLSELTDQRHPVNGQEPYIAKDWFEQYDNNTNVDAFGLLHNEFFDHLVLLPGVQLQKNNPGNVTRTGDGFNYKIDYSYTYNNKGYPMSRKGNAIITTGPETGRRFQTNSVYSYY